MNAIKPVLWGEGDAVLEIRWGMGKKLKNFKETTKQPVFWPRQNIKIRLFNKFISLLPQKKVEADALVTQKTVQDALDILRGAVTIVYPMGLPPYDPIRAEFENTEDLSGKQVWVFNSSLWRFIFILKLREGDLIV